MTPDAAVTIDELRGKIRALDQRIADIEGMLASAEAENDALKYELLEQKALADEYAALVGQLDDLFGVRSLPLRLALAEFGRAVGARAVIFD